MAFVQPHCICPQGANIDSPNKHVCNCLVKSLRKVLNIVKSTYRSTSIAGTFCRSHSKWRPPSPLVQHHDNILSMTYPRIEGASSSQTNVPGTSNVCLVLGNPVKSLKINYILLNYIYFNQLKLHYYITEHFQDSSLKAYSVDGHEEAGFVSLDVVSIVYITGCESRRRSFVDLHNLHRAISSCVIVDSQDKNIITTLDLENYKEISVLKRATNLIVVGKLLHLQIF